MEPTGAKVRNDQAVEQGQKKAYHRPVLRVCGTVQQHTRTGPGPFEDATETPGTEIFS